MTLAFQASLIDVMQVARARFGVEIMPNDHVAQSLCELLNEEKIEHVALCNDEDDAVQYLAVHAEIERQWRADPDVMLFLAKKSVALG